jgi:hypothetical protein
MHKKPSWYFGFRVLEAVLILLGLIASLAWLVSDYPVYERLVPVMDFLILLVVYYQQRGE